MVHLDAALAKEKDLGEKGLKSGALGLFSSVVVGVASTAPAYSLAATLGFVVIAIKGLQAPIIAILAFVPMLFISYAYKELNNADPDCGTTFTWATRAFGPKTGWFGGWGIVAADILVMASLAQIAGQYVFLLFGAKSIGGNPSSTWVLLVGVAWIVVMTAICYVGVEISANMQKVLLGIEVVVLVIFSIVAFVKIGSGKAPAGHLTPSAQWFNPFHNLGFTSFMVGFSLMLFIYWGWDTAVSVNEETKDSTRTPGRAAVISTLILLATYAIVIVASQSYAGIGSTGIGLSNPANSGDVLNSLGFVGVRHLGDRGGHGQAAALDGAHLGGGIDTDHDSADGPHHALHGGLQVDSGHVRQGAQALPHANDVDGGDGGGLHRALRGDELPVQREQRDRGLRVRPRGHDRLLLRAHRLRLRLVLPQEPQGEHPQLLAARRPPPAGWPHPLVRHGVVHLVQLGHSQQQLHHLDHPGHAQGRRWCVRPDRRLLPSRRRPPGDLPVRPSRLLPGQDAQPGHADPGARRHRRAGRAVRDRAVRRRGRPRQERADAGLPHRAERSGAAPFR